MPICAEGTQILVPGKLVIAGEYAVLDGAPALVLAIKHGVSCHVLAGSGIETPMRDDRFVAPALGNLSQHKRYRFADWNPIKDFGEDKPGFGGSAAACVAACIAAGRDPNDAFTIHHQVQGSGSGIDVAASIHGGLLRFQNKRVTHHKPIHPLVIWSGQSARTGPRVQKYLSLEKSLRLKFVHQSTELVNQFDINPVETLRHLYRALCTMADRAQLTYNTPTIKSIVSLVEYHGGGAKPSGAGGGDCVIALFPSLESQRAFQKNSPFPHFIAQACMGIQYRTVS